MKALVIYYSRTGATRKIAEVMREKLQCDSEEISTTDSRTGLFGYIKCGFEAVFKKTPKIKAIKTDPGVYTIVIIGTPVWASTMSSPIRAYLAQNKGSLKKVAFFCTHSSPGSGNTFKDMGILCEKEPLVLLDLKTGEVAKNDYAGGIDKFVYEIIEKAG